ncbi:MAG: ATP-binding protein [Methanoregula sp.]|nr:ATP-binding protein [Methanoregula sp.]
MKNPSNENSCCILTQSLNPIIFTLDDLGTLTYVSEGCRKILGFLPREMIGRPISMFISPEEKGSICEMSGPAKRGITVPSNFHMAGKDGGLYPAISLSLSVFPNHEKTGMIGIIWEDSNGKQTEKIVRQANTRLHFLNSIIRHDINNQLTVLNGYLSLMEQDDGTLPSPEIITILLNATDKIHKIVTFTKEYQDLGAHLPVWMNLYELFESARSTRNDAGVQIDARLSCQDLELFTIPELIKVFYHLIDNSIRHGNAVSEISLQWRLENGEAIIVYEDNGCGIPQNIKPALFLRGKGKNTGYGLFLVHEILAITGYTIAETGSPGKGVRFEIVVPAGSFRIAEKKPQ